MSELQPGNIFHPDFPELLPAHVDHLKASGIADEVIRERGYESVLGVRRLKDVGFATYQVRRGAGILMPIHTPDGMNSLYQYRPDNPRTDQAGKVFKYETPAGAGIRLDVPRRCQPQLGDPSVPLWITEGIKKGDAAASHGLCVVVLIGVWGFRGRNQFGGVTWQADWQYIDIQDRVINICFDSDVMVNQRVRSALNVLTEMLHRKGATVRHIFLPGGPNGEKVGLDDFLLTHEVADLDRYIVTPLLEPPRKPDALERRLALTEKERVSDTGNAYRLVNRHGVNLRHCFSWGKWLTYTSTRWEEDKRGQVIGWAKDTVRAIFQEAMHAPDPDIARELSQWALTSESMAKLEAMIKAARNEISVTPEEFDIDPYLLNVQNGTIDLRAGTLREHRRDDFLTKLAPVVFDASATAPRWQAFLERILPDPDLRWFVQKAAGYSLTGDVSAQVLFYAYGNGSNGKSTFLLVLRGLLGDYAKQAAPDLLVAKDSENHPTEIADLAGVRFLATTEISEGKRAAEALIKQMTGGDPLRARRMREDFWEFLPTHKIWLAANHKLVIRGTDDAIWRRIRLIPFVVTIEEGEKDPELGAKLRLEYPGILNWALAGYQGWQTEGLKQPESVRTATESYRREMDVLATFLADRCVATPNAKVKKRDFYNEYKSWCDESGERGESQRALSGHMRERGFDEMVSTGNYQVWLGVGLSAKEA